MHRIDTLDAPPIPGERYLVPCLRGPRGWSPGPEAKTRWWPVLLPEHTDHDFFALRERHYHIDIRFIESERMAPTKPDTHAETSAFRAVIYPLIANAKGKEQIAWRAMICREVPGLAEYETAIAPHMNALRRHYAGATCPKVDGRRHCPHRMADLESVKADEDGVITCPMHGLKIDTRTWRVKTS